MKKMTPKQERQLLNDCIKFDMCDALFIYYWYMVEIIVKRVFIRKRASHIEEDLEDARQEVFVRLFQNDKKLLRDYKPDKRSLANWIMMIANHTTLNYLNKKRKDTVRRIWDKSGDMIDNIPEPDRNIEEKIDLKNRIKNLSGNERLILNLQGKGYSSKEIAKIIGSTEGAVNTKLYRIKKKLRIKN
ncbi:sigma-70 family RNA polymerase sigma factor [Desulfococcaceae bacterium HSG9]|nr:sigma-70 family RNA polymerase sigma factor [Desulfococcaceae bacterium HSG9]